MKGLLAAPLSEQIFKGDMISQLRVKPRGFPANEPRRNISFIWSCVAPNVNFLCSAESFGPVCESVAAHVT